MLKSHGTSSHTILKTNPHPIHLYILGLVLMRKDLTKYTRTTHHTNTTHWNNMKSTNLSFPCIHVCCNPYFFNNNDKSVFVNTNTSTKYHMVCDNKKLYYSKTPCSPYRDLVFIFVEFIQIKRNTSRHNIGQICTLLKYRNNVNQASIILKLFNTTFIDFL